MIAVLTVALVLTACTATFFLWPLLEETRAENLYENFFRTLESLIYEKEMLLENLKDLELDKTLQKIALPDYQDLRSKLMMETSSIYSKIEKLESQQIIIKTIE